MKYLQNLHTHSTFCDGKHTPEEMVRFAIDKGFSSLGFSSHSASWRPDRNLAEWLPKNVCYREEVNRLREAYRDNIEIYLGLEVEAGVDFDLSEYDYLIGAVHLLRAGDGYFEVDSSLERTKWGIERYFGGSGIDYAVSYYRQLAEMPSFGNFDIVAHFDLITKFSEREVLFDESDPRYMRAALDAMDALEGKIPFFEVNTGAISRAYRSSPYPSIALLREFLRRDFGVVVTTDCHNGEYLDCHYRESLELLRAVGFRERYILTKDGFCAISLD